MFHLVFYTPQIPPNTGNAIRLCANTPACLHLIHPLGFTMDDKSLRRAGLDYHEYSKVIEHESYEAFRVWAKGRKIYAITTSGTQSYTNPSFKDEDVFLFGSETSGLPAEVMSSISKELRLRIPMREGARSLNLSNSASILVYEAWRQLNFKDTDI